MNLFGGAAKFVDFQNSKGGEFVANSDGTKFGTMINDMFVGYFDPDPYTIPLTFEAIEAGAVVEFDNDGAAGPVTYKWSGGEAQTIAGGGRVAISLNSGDKVEFWGDNKTYTTEYYSCIKCYGDCYVYGNIMSLIKSVGFENEKTLEQSNTFSRLFYDNDHIKNKNGSYLLLPATTLTEGCYESMFSGCKSLTSAPALPATTLAKSCYSYMFHRCSNLTSTPELPATTLAQSCYEYMFARCSSLTSAPKLPATTLAKNCYNAMFYNSANLSSVTCLATDISEMNYTPAWLNGVASNGTFIKAAGATWPEGSSGIPSGWTVQDYQG